jgi:hypothetical protein
MLGGDADGDVRIEILAACFRNKRRDVVDCRLVDARLFGRRNERRSGPNFRRERGDRVDQALLQLEQIVSRLNDNARKANVLPGNVVVFESLQFPVGSLRFSQDRASRRIDFVKVRRADIALQNRNVWMVCLAK